MEIAPNSVIFSNQPEFIEKQENGQIRFSPFAYLLRKKANIDVSTERPYHAFQNSDLEVGAPVLMDDDLLDNHCGNSVSVTVLQNRMHSFLSKIMRDDDYNI